MKTQIIDDCIVQLNDVPKEFAAEQYINGCGLIASIAQKLVKIREDAQADENTINKLQAEIRETGREIVGVMKEGGSDGE